MVNLDMCRGLNHIGRLGEHEHRRFRFPDSAEVLAMYPEATVSVLVKRPGDSVSYPVAPGYVEIQSGSVYWTVQSADLARIGRGNVELTFVDGTTVAKNIIYDVYVDKALDGAGDPPEPWESWQTDITAIAGEIAGDRAAAEQAAEDAIEAQGKAEAAQEAAESAERAAGESAGAADTSARAAAESAGAADRSAGAADQSAQAAGRSATAADQSAQAAAGSVTAAGEQAGAANASARAAAASALEAERMTFGTEGGVPVPATSPYNENNAKHYAELTQAAETTAVQAINTAGTNQVNAVQNKGTQVLNSIPADYTELSGEVSDLKSAIAQLPKSVDTDAENVDLDVVDPSGNVIVRMAGGHIKTKEFDSSELQNKFDGKQNALTFDDTPTSGSDNPVKSGGVFFALSEKQASLTFDNEPTVNSTNPVKSSGIYGAIQAIKNDLPKVVEPQETEADLYVCDSDGNVIAKFVDGHIVTKNFDSASISLDLIMEADSAEADLYITDMFGNVIAEFGNGHIKTKNFDSEHIDFSGLETAVEEITNEVSVLKSKTTGIVYRTKDQTDGVYAACRYHQPNVSSKQFCMLIAGDIHTDPPRMNSIIEYLNEVDAFDCGIMLGDISGNTFNDPIVYYTSAIQSANKPFLTVLGNHDVVGATSDSDLYTKFGDCFQYAQLATGEAVSGKCYYFKDFTAQKIRLIVLMQYDLAGRASDTGDLCFGQDQIDWLISVLNSTPSDYGVIIAEHTNPSRYMTYNMDEACTSSTWYRSNYAPTVMNGDPVPDIVNAWINGSTLSQTYSYTFSNPPAPLSVSADFSSRGTGEFITYIGGHWHMNVLGSPTGFADQMDYHVPAAGLSAATQGDMPRRSGTVSEDSFDVIAIDRDKKTVKVFQIGAHYTKDAIDRQYFKYSYGA